MMEKMPQKIVFALLGVFSTFSANAWDFESDGYCYNKLTDTTCALALPTGKGSLSHYSGDIVVPSHVSYRGVEYTVTEISSCAFSWSNTSGSSITYNEELLSVQLPNTIEYINANAFRGCNKLISIKIPSSVLGIGYTAFEGCSKISEVIIEDSEQPIKIACGNTSYRGIFSSCPLKKVYIGRNIIHASNYGVNNGYNYAFDERYGPFTYKQYLKTIEISPYVTELEEYMFYNSTGIQSVLIGENVKKIGRNAFSSCSNLSIVYGNKNLEEVSYQSFSGISANAKIYLFSLNISKVESEAFKNNSIIYVLDKEYYEPLLGDYNMVQMFVVPPAQKEYTGMPITIDVVNNSDLTIDCLKFPVNVGLYERVDCDIKISEDIMSITIPCKIEIFPVPLLIIANNATKVYGSENPEFICSFFGFKNGENASVLTRLPDIETTATLTSDVGTYPIIPYGAEAQNYTFNYERGTLTITKADQTILWEQQFEVANVGDVVELTAMSSAGLPIKYVSTDESIAEIFNENGKKFVEFLKPGDVSIRATQVGNENYNEADRISKSITVKRLVSHIELDPIKWAGVVGGTFQIKATILPEDASNKTLKWISSDENVAVVNENGLVKVLKNGSCEIIACATDGSGQTALCEVDILSGIDNNVFDSDESISIFNELGILLYRNVSSSTIQNLTPGIYIVIQGKQVKKMIVK